MFINNLTCQIGKYLAYHPRSKGFLPSHMDWAPYLKEEAPWDRGCWRTTIMEKNYLDTCEKRRCPWHHKQCTTNLKDHPSAENFTIVIERLSAQSSAWFSFWRCFSALRLKFNTSASLAVFPLIFYLNCMFCFKISMKVKAFRYKMFIPYNQLMGKLPCKSLFFVFRHW